MNWLINVGKHICELRDEKGMTQEELAESARISPSFLGMIERGQSIPSVATLLKIAKSLNISINQLFFKSDKLLSEKPVTKFGQEEVLDNRITSLLKTLSHKEKRLLLNIIKQIIRKPSGKK